MFCKLFRKYGHKHLVFVKIAAFFSEKEQWQSDSEKIKEEKRKLENQKEQDDIKIKEYSVSIGSFFIQICCSLYIFKMWKFYTVKNKTGTVM